MRIYQFCCLLMCVTSFSEAVRDVGPDMKPIPEPRPPLPGSARSRPRKREMCHDGKSTLNAEQIEESLSHHNDLRTQVAQQDPAADIIKLAYDGELADLAQLVVETCVLEHQFLNRCDGKRVGQNLAVSTAKNPNITSFIDMWFKEKTYYSITNGCEEGKVCGHYTQVAWGNTQLVGCAQKLCPTLSIGGRVYSDVTFYGCNYFPPGNVNGQKPYIEDSACSRCDNVFTNNTYKCEYDLCVGCNPATDSECNCIDSVCPDNQEMDKVTCNCPSCPTGTCGATCSFSDLSPHCSYWKNCGYCASNSVYYGFMQKNCKCTCMA